MQPKPTQYPAASMNQECSDVELQRACPFCESEKSTPIKQIHLVVPESFSLQRTFTINACKSCGGIFHGVKPQADRDSYYESYTGSDAIDYSVTADQARLNDLTMGFLERADLASLDQSILDVGCSFGITLMSLKKRGFNNLFAIDPDRAAIGFLKRQGISGQIGTAIDLCPELDNKFDLIILRHVLEHLYSPLAAIENISRWLKPGGKIYIELPDLLRYEECGLFPGYFFEHEHINHFTLFSLLNLMRGFSLTNFESTPEIYPCMRGIFEPSPVKRPLHFSSTDIQLVNNSFFPSSSISKNLLGNISNLSGKQIALWGVSVFVYRLLTHTLLGSCNISKMVDSNPKQQGEKLFGITIEPPESLRSFTGEIVICGGNSADSIEQSIRQLGFRNPIVHLMRDPDACSRSSSMPNEIETA